MENKTFFSAFISELKSKWFIIVVLAIILGAGLLLEKRGSGTGAIYVSTSSYAQCLVKVNLNDSSKIHDINDSGFFSNSSLLKYSFLKESEKNYDYSKFNANFPLLKEENKVAWIDKRLWTATYYPNLFLFSFSVSDEDAKDVEYVNANMEKYILQYVEYCDQKLQKAGVGSLEIIDKAFMPAEGTFIPGKSFVLKYGMIGAVLGFAIGILIIAGFAMRKLKND